MFASRLKFAFKTLLQHSTGPLRPFAQKILRSRENYNRTYLICHEPDGDDTRPVTGSIVVRGACFTQRRGDVVVVQIGGVSAVLSPVLISKYDSTISSVTGDSRFAATLDSGALPNGLHLVKIRLLSRKRKIRELSIPINIDHEHGFGCEYERWIADFEVPAQNAVQRRLGSLAYRPMLAVIAGRLSTRARDSLLEQSYSNYELRADSAPGAAEYVCWIEKGTALATDAFAFIVEALNRDRDIDLLYGDEDAIDAEGRRSDPFFKPSWSPDLALSLHYAGGLLIVRSQIFRSLQFDNASELVLKAAVQAKRIERVPRVLSHRETDCTVYPLAELLGGQRLEPGRIPGTRRARYPIPASSFVSIIVASGGAVEALDANLHSIIAMNSGAHFEILVVDNGSDKTIEAFLKADWARDKRVRHLDCRGQPFNYSALNNYAVSQCRSGMLLFLNDDTTGAEQNWIEAMLELALRPEVGAVGAKLLYPNGLIQHAGIVLGVFGHCGHAFRWLSGAESHYFGFSDVIRNVSAVTAACLMTRRNVFEEVGGFDEEAFAVALNDVDLCLKIGQLGLRILYTPFAVLCHHEAYSKRAEHLEPAPSELAAFRSKWVRQIADDPFYSPNLTRTCEDYSLPKKSLSPL